MRKKFIIILALSVCIALFPVFSAGASENESSVFVILKNDGQAVEDVVFTLYYIAKKENGMQSQAR